MGGLIQGVASIVPMFTNIKLNGCSSQYDIWGLLDGHGRFLNEMFLSSKEQSAFLKERFSAADEIESTITLPPYSQKAAKDLEVCHVVSGNKLARTYPEGGQLDMMLERARLFRSK